MTGIVFLGFVNIFIVFYGVCSVRKAAREEALPEMLLVLREDDDYLEGLLRYYLQQIYKYMVINRIVILYEVTGRDTAAILTRYGLNMSIIVREINYLPKPCTPYMLDLRSCQTRREKCRLIKKFLRERQLLYQMS